MERKMKVLSVLLAALFLAQAASADLVAYYKFDNDLVDSSGNNPAAVIFPAGSPHVSFGAGYDNQAIWRVPSGQTSDNNRDYVNTGITDTGTGSLSIASWVYLDSASVGTASFLAGKVYTQRDWALDITTSNTVQFRVAPASNSLAGVITTSNMLLDQWVHVAAVYDAPTASMKIYLNGVEQTVTTSGTIPTSRFNNTMPVQILGRNGTLQYWRGGVDEFRVYTSALSQAEVQAAMIPEPATLALLGLGALAAFRRKR